LKQEEIEERGTQRNISFRSEDIELYKYVEQLANSKFRGNFSNAIADCILAHKRATEAYGAWEVMGRD